MKIAVTATGTDLDAPVDTRFGRCQIFMFVDPDTMEAEAIRNDKASLGGGAGIQAAQLVIDNDADAVLTGNCGPNAFRTLQAGEVTVCTGISGTVREAVERFTSGELQAVEGANVSSHYGTA